MISFQDIFKSNFLENVTSVTMLDMVLSIVLAFLVGLFIFFVYKKTYSGVMYSPSFGVSLIAMTMVTSLVILAVASNVVLSLGMVGALSIVRFRTAIKEPLDIAYLFWAIAAGIVLAAGMIPLAVFGSVAIGVILLIFVNRKPNTRSYIAMVTCDNPQTEQMVGQFLASTVEKQEIKSKTVTPGRIELNYEVRLKDGDTSFINGLSGIAGVTAVALVSYNGEYMS